jgi:hypothetical protein
MKASRLVALTGMILLGFFLTTQVVSADRSIRKTNKKAVVITLDKPMLDFVIKAYAEQIDASDIVRVQKMLGQIDHITVSFCDTEACDYIVKFKPLDEQGLEAWMFSEGYLSTSDEPEPTTIEAWMLDTEYLE